ncbi:hypothetical protein QTP70_027915 [Hemibagrus guttatus]|uniref:Neuronal growth regulator 1 n=1 Tax=Hemibagrus guttatus TaxID=175788 RepID=A0AAE0RM22_9TELE|nr:hypothetical protein QTP70_027915 [Hemibagrus guttatus]
MNWNWSLINIPTSESDLTKALVELPPKIYDISPDITVNEGGDISLFCLASGKPEPKITWRHISPSVQMHSQRLICKVQSQTEKLAGLVGETVLRESKLGLTVEMERAPSPRSVMYSPAALVLSAAGRPEGNTPCALNTMKFESGENLNISGITRDAAGDYECGAENDIASPDTRTVKVTVN